jgi:hypothetical protein
MSWFDNYNILLDEAGHLVLSIIPLVMGLQLGTSFTQGIIILLSGLLIDVDHILNVPIARLLGLRYKPHVWKGSNNYIIKPLHGVDVSILIGLLVYAGTTNELVSTLITLSLLLHNAWDYAVYNNHWHSLFLITRAKNSFYVTERTNHQHIVFATLPPRITY